MIRLPTGLRTRLFLIFLIAVAPVIVLTFYLSLDHRERETQRAQNELARLAELAALHQQQVTQNTQLLLVSLAQTSAIQSGDRVACNAFLAELLKRQTAYANFGLSDVRGNIYCSALPLTKTVNISDRRYFREALAARAFSMGEAQIGRITGKATQNFGHAVLDPNGVVRGVVYAALDLNWLETFRREAKLPADTATLVVDHQGALLARYPDPKRWAGTDTSQMPIVQIMLRQRIGSVEAAGLDGVTRLHAFTPLDSSPEPIYVAIGVAKKTVSAAANRVLVLSLAGIILAAGLAFVAARFAGQFFILRQVQDLVSTVDHLRGGELHARTALAHDQGELGILAKSLDDMAQALEQLTRRNQLILQSAGEGIYGVDHAGLTTFANPAATRMLGYELPQILGRPAYEVLQPSRSDGTPYTREECPISVTLHTGAGYHADNEIFWRQDGRSFPVEYVSTPIQEQDMVTGAVIVFKDISARSALAQAERLKFQATHDELTGLANRLLFYDRLRQAILTGQRTKEHFALFILDMDRFKDINDKLGHQLGDRALQETATRLRAALREADTLARFGGDEFVALLPATHRDGAIQSAAKLTQALAQPLRIEQHALTVGVSIGIALFPEHGKDIDDLIRCADIAMYQAKRAGSGYKVYAA